MIEAKGDLNHSIRVVKLITLIADYIFDGDNFAPCLGARVVFPGIFPKTQKKDQNFVDEYNVKDAKLSVDK